MEGTYFSFYKTYNTLLRDQYLSNKANTLVEDVFFSSSKVYQYVNEIGNSKWIESGKCVIDNTVSSWLKREIETLIKQIDKLSSACKYADELYEKTEQIRKSDITLSDLKSVLSRYSHSLIGVSKTKTEIIDGVEKQVNNYAYYKIANLIYSQKLKVIAQEKKVILLCEEANNLIALILGLDGMSSSKILSILPRIRENGTSIEEDQNISPMATETITLDKLLAASESGALPFILYSRTPKDFLITDSGEIRVRFKKDDEYGILLIPSNTKYGDVKDLNVYMCGSDTGPCDSAKASLKVVLEDTQDKPMILLSRKTDYANEAKTERRNKNVAQLQNDIEIVNTFKEYIGSKKTNVHLFAHSQGVREAYIMVSKNPDYFTTATFVEGRAADSEYAGLISNSNTKTRINIVIAIDDKTVTPEEQLKSYFGTSKNPGGSLDVNCNFYGVKLGDKYHTYNNSPKYFETDFSKAASGKFEDFSGKYYNRMKEVYDFESTPYRTSTTGSTVNANCYLVEQVPSLSPVHTGTLISIFKNPSSMNYLTSINN